MVANVEMANQIAVGAVSSLSGTVKAISLDGSERILQAGDQVHADEVLITGASASVNIKFNNGSTLDLASDARATLDSDVYGGTTAEDAAASVEAVQQAIAEGQDPTATLPAPGAGIAGSEGGHDFVRVDLIDQRVDPENGFETEGLSFNVERPEEELLFIQPRDVEPQEPPSPVPEISVAALIVDEEYGAGVVVEGNNESDDKVIVFRVSLSSTSNQTVTVEYNIDRGTADAPLDYNDNGGLRPLSGILTFNPGDEYIDVTIDITEDTEFEPAPPGAGENFYIVLLENDNLTNGTISATGKKAIATIIDDDMVPSPVPEISVAALIVDEEYGAGVVVEGNNESDDKVIVFRVSLSSTSNQTVTVEYNIDRGTADAPLDYNDNGGLRPLSGILTFNPGDEYIDVTIDITEDTEFEPAPPGAGENFYIVLLENDNLTNGTISATGKKAIATIIDDDGPIVTINSVNAVPEADPVLTNADSAQAGLDASLGDVIYFKALDVGNGLDGGITIYESPVSDLGGADAETAESALVFTLNSLPEYGTLYIDLNADDATGATWTAMSAGDTFSTADALYWVATSTDTIGNIGDISPIIGGSKVLADWLGNPFVTFSGRSQGGTEFLESNLGIIDNTFSGGYGLGVTGGAHGAEVEYNPDTREAEALKISFADAITAMTINFSLFYGGEGISGELAEITAYDALGNVVGTTTVAGEPDVVWGKNKPGDISHTISFGGAGFTSLILEPQPFDSGVNNDSSDFAIKSIDLTPGIVQFDYTVTDSEGMASDIAPVVIDLNGEPSEFVVDGQVYKIGSAGDDILVGQSGNEIISGNAGEDSIFGKGGNDILDGGDDNDIIYGGTGDDNLTGGNGVDSFIWISGDDGTEVTPAVDTITDFVTGVGGDVINLDDLLPATVNSSTLNLDSYLNFALVGSNTEIQIDPDGAGGVTQTIILEGIDLVTGNTNTQIITQLVNDGNLII
ncbi:MAG: retention module-containing protein [Gammaproteobacteria bacterium]|nr:retention module-containing protein [Gammaproteobacteria bacterium]